jgi:hypothetical protein
MLVIVTAKTDTNVDKYTFNAKRPSVSNNLRNTNNKSMKEPLNEWNIIVNKIQKFW